MRAKPAAAFALACGLSLLAAGCTAAVRQNSGASIADPVERWSLAQRTGYAAGFNIGEALSPDRAYIDVGMVRAGIQDAAARQTLRYSDAEQLKAKTQVQALQASPNQPPDPAVVAPLVPPFSYAIGTRIVRFSRHAGNRLDLDFLADGLEERFSGRPARIDEATRMKLQEALAKS